VDPYRFPDGPKHGERQTPSKLGAVPLLPEDELLGAEVELISLLDGTLLDDPEPEDEDSTELETAAELPIPLALAACDELPRAEEAEALVAPPVLDEAAPSHPVQLSKPVPCVLHP